eukprot:CAMPEP_0180704188 /NCGR_PEP_ID=MMETSP1038_2-20121128/7018_1 /TAXON_ID=632150 /ORGANISM="Azadinium spinosum, Strain 3D9" /LENGTH=254 /DNA_ID=CAMNT_0022735995 /DNA_START=179 /DNA_END=940 /DNA_ORIENTATION=-
MSNQELRIDPTDGNAYTFEQINAFYRQQYNAWQIKEYWSSMPPLAPPQPPELRFSKGDRVLCNVGDRRLIGTVLDKDVEDPEDPEEDNLAYVVKTDAIPGALESRTISAPSDFDEVICRERCFAQSEVALTKWAAPIILPNQRKPLRFNLKDKVAIRVQDHSDGYEQWVCGEVLEVWPVLKGKPKEGFLRTAEAVPYKVAVEKRGVFYCHRDEHTLIRLPENIPRTLVKTISKRFENRKLPDGAVEKFDHVTLR